MNQKTSIKWPVKMSTACIIIDANGDYLTTEQDAEVCRRANEYKSLVDAHAIYRGIISRNDKREKRINELEQQLERLVEAAKILADNCFYPNETTGYGQVWNQIHCSRVLLEKVRKG